MTSMTSEGQRSYLRAMRQGLRITHKEMGAKVGRSWRSWLSFEKGNTQDLKAPVLQKAIEALQIPIADIEALKNADAQTGERLAHQRLRERELLTDEERLAIERAIPQALPGDTEQAIEIMEELQRDPALRKQWLIYGKALVDVLRRGGS